MNTHKNQITEYGFRQRVLDFIVNLPNLYPEIQKIVLYGSRAKGTFKPGSDIDLAVYGPGLDFDTVREITNYLEGLPTLYQFDVTHMDTLKHQGLKDHVGRVGKLIYDCKP